MIRRIKLQFSLAKLLVALRSSVFTFATILRDSTVAAAGDFTDAD
jgi:hypothetical protein